MVSCCSFFRAIPLDGYSSGTGTENNRYYRHLGCFYYPHRNNFSTDLFRCSVQILIDGFTQGGKRNFSDCHPGPIEGIGPDNRLNGSPLLRSGEIVCGQAR